MAKVKYIGPHDAVVTPLPTGGEALTERGGVLSTSADHAEALLRQSSWVDVSAADNKKAAKPGAATDDKKEEDAS